MKIKMILLLITMLSASVLKAQNDTQQIMYEAYLSNEQATGKWKKAIALLEAEFSKDKENTDLSYKLCMAYFGLLSSTMRTKDEDLFDQYYKGTEKLLDQTIKKNPEWGEPRALLSAVYGLKMGYSPMQGMFLGPKSSSLVEKAKSLSPQSGFVWKVYANSKFFTPEMWGGDLIEAIGSYEKAIHLYEKNQSSLKYDWTYIDALAFLGQAYQKNGDTGKAIVTYEKALKVEPAFEWVKKVLLQSAKSKAGK